MIENMIWSQLDGLCRHYWVTFFIIPLVLLICLWLIQCGPQLLRSLYSLHCEIHNNWQKSISFFFLNRKSFSGFRTAQVFVVAQTRRKLQKQSHFFIWPSMYQYFLRFWGSLDTSTLAILALLPLPKDQLRKLTMRKWRRWRK